MEFREGDKVEITIRGTVREKTAEHWYTNRIQDERGYNHFVLLSNADTNGSLTVTRVISDWPPQLGDIWESEGKEYAALWANRAEEHNVTLHAVDKVVVYEADEFREFPGLRLVRRRESS
jgi:hypothetical protein